MPGFELEQVDGGGPVDLPYGETVLGRGPLLGVNDKRVSRTHGLLENSNGQLRLKPLHLNPCFVQASIVATPQPLEKNQWHFLQEGDIFSLMPGKYIYRVHKKQEDPALRNSQALEEEVEVEKSLTETAEPSEEPNTPLAKRSVPMTQSSTLTGSLGEDGSLHTPVSLNQVPTVNTQEASDVLQKKRVLPAWMMICASTTGSPSAAKGERAAAKGTPTPKRVTGPKRARAKRLSSEEEEEEEEKPVRKAKRLKSNSDEESEIQDDVTAPKKNKVGSVQDGPGEDSDSSSLMERDDGRRKGGNRGGKVKRGAKTDSQTPSKGSSNTQVNQGPSQNRRQRSESTESESKTSTGARRVKQRTPCSYGTSCYRKNPIHFQECSHPGDSDYEEEEAEEEDDDRPECPYGTHCYRKNLLHKKEYKHTKSPPKSSAADDEDEDHYDNSFINDESEEEEVDDDSDYVPESEDNGKEDIKRLQKEAKAFIRRKK